MRKLIPALLLLLSPAFIQAQTGTSPLKPAGPLPELYRCPSHITIDKEVARRDASGNPIPKDEEVFMREMLYYSQQRMISGFVLFNDSLSDYVSKVGAEVLKNDTATLNKLHFYVYKSAAPNAYTSASGTILMTVGLLAQLENEAQLAYILCHEITHYRREHMLKGYLNREELKNRENTPYYLLQSSYLSYNQEQEFEADRLGLDLFLQSSYSKKEAIRTFDVLEYSNLPFDDVPFDTLFFNQDYMKIPVGYYEKEVDPIYSDDNYDDKNSTHPNVRKRRMALMTIMDTIKDKEGSLFVVSKNEFLRVRESARYELCRLYLEEREYPDAIYASYMMLKRHPDDLMLRTIIGRSLYNLAAYSQSGGKRIYGEYDWLFGGYSYRGKYASLGRAGRYRVPNPEDYPGQQQQLYHLFGKIEPDELAALALNYNWRIYKSNPSDSLQKKICDNLISMLVNQQNLHLSYFSTISPNEAREQLKKDSLERVKETGETGDSKFTRIDKFKLSSEKELFTKFAFVELLKDTEFVARFKYYTDNRDAFISDTDLSMYDDKSKKERKAEEEKAKSYGYGITKLIISGPDFSEYNQLKRKEEPEQDYAASEIGQTGMTHLLKTEANKSGVQTIVLNPFTMDSLAGDTFADLALINEWFFEKMGHGSHDYALNVSNQTQIDSLIKKYGTQYVMLTTMEVYHYKKIQHPFWFGVSCLAVVPAIRAFIPRNQMYFDVAVVDIKTGEVILTDHQKVKKGKTPEVSSEFYKKLFDKMNKPKPPVEKKKDVDGKPATEKERGM